MKIFPAVKFVLIPFAAFWALLGARHPDWAIWSGFALSVAGNLWRTYRGEFVLLEAGGLALFAVIGHAQLLNPEWAAVNALWLCFAGLGAISFSSVLLGRPYTADYSRAAYPDSVATPQFRIINAALTGLWGALFLAMAACRWLGVSEWIATAIPVAGVLVSIFGPKLAIGLSPRRPGAARETFIWPAPSFAQGGAADCDVAVAGAGIGGLTAAGRAPARSTEFRARGGSVDQSHRCAIS